MMATTQPRVRGVAWPDVLRVLPDDETRSCAIHALRDAGFSADSFGHSRAARVTVAEALTRIEDRLEVSGPAVQRQRAEIRNVRRALEVEVWP